MAESREDVLAKIERANRVVRELCQGERRWVMSVPARPDDDPDIVIADALDAARWYIVGDTEKGVSDG